MKKGKPSNSFEFASYWADSNNTVECSLPDAQTEELEAKCEGRILDISYIPHRK